MKWYLFTFLSLGYSLFILAQGPPIITETPIMLGLEGSGVRTFGKFISKENANIYIQPIGIPYNINPKFQFGAIFPFKFITPKGEETTGGFADLTVFLKHQLYKIDGKAETFRIIGLVKQTFPTGSTSSTPEVGSGLHQTYIGLVIGKITIKKGLYGDVGYNITNKNASDNFIYNFAIGLPLLPHKYPQKQLNTYFEFNGNYSFGPKEHTVFISPGLQFIPGRRFLLETSFQIPIVQENISLNKTNYMILLGTRILIN